MESTRRAHKKGCPGYVQGQLRRIQCRSSPPLCLDCWTDRLTCGYGYRSAHCVLVPNPLPSLSSLAAAWKPDHAASLHYFRTLAADDFHGYLASDFWTSMLYQKSEHCAPVRGALVAISNAHRDRVAALAKPLPASTLKCYGKAIRLAVEHMQESTVSEVRATSLFCCAIFYCFELFNKSPQAADIHLDNGLRLLREWHRTCPSWPPSNLHATLRDHFLRLLYTMGRLDLDRMLRDVSAVDSDHNDKIFTSGLMPSLHSPADDDDFELKCRMMLLSRHVTRFTRFHNYPDTMPICEVPVHVLFTRLQLQCQIAELEAVLDQREAQLHETRTPSASQQQRLTALYTFRLYLVTHRVRLLTMLALDPTERTAIYDGHADMMLRYAKMARDSFGVQRPRAPLMPEPGVLLPIQWLAKSVSRADSRRDAHEFIDEYYAVEGVCMFELDRLRGRLQVEHNVCK